MRYDYLLLGGGLQSGLLALAIRHRKPSATIAIVERNKCLGGNHTWSFHAGDVPDESRAWFDPLVQWRWDGYDVIFPHYRRRIGQAYGAFTGTQLDAVVRANFSQAPNCDLFVGTEATHVRHDAIGLADGRRVHAHAVIDARGPELAALVAHSGYQKFLGLEVRLSAPHQLKCPILMDARVAQLDGMRFFYVLPLDRDRVLVEDTRFSDGPVFDAVDLRERTLAKIAEYGWRIAEVVREERGVLPMPCEPGVSLQGRIPVCGGYAGGWFNPATGYSLPLAVRFAQFVADQRSPRVDCAAHTRALVERDRQAEFFLLLNRMLFDATPPAVRRNVFECFYKLPEACITRFYAMRLQPRDYARILLRRPPQGIRLGRSLSLLVKWALSAQRPAGNI